MSELTGQVLGDRYRVEAFLGRGGMADVYKVRDSQRAAFLAMKILHPELAKSQSFLDHFVQEAQILERLQHPNIVRFYGLEKADNLAFILMDFIDGLTLRREIFLFKNSLRMMRALEIMQPVCAALYYAHQMGMIHCDIKPANIITHRNGTVFLTDFGIARATEPGNASLEGVGTPAYMAPELFEGKQPTQATDIYSLGVVLFEILTGGQRPFSGDSAQTGGPTGHRIIWEKQHLTAPSPRTFNPEITSEVEAVVMCCLQRNPRLRFRTALDLQHALEVALCGAQQPDGDAQTQVDLVKKPGKTGRLKSKRQASSSEGAKESSANASANGAPFAEAFAASTDEAGKLVTASAQAQPEIGKAQPPLAGETQAQSEKYPSEREPPPANGLPGGSEAKLPAQKPAPAPASQPAGSLTEAPPGGSPALPPSRWAKLNPWLMAGAGLLAMALIANAIFSGHAQAPTPTQTPVMEVTASFAPVSTPTALPLSSATPQAKLDPAAPILAQQPTETIPPEPTPMGGSRRIAFASDRSGSVQIWIMDALNPENRQQVTNARDGACQPAWSPDGTQIAFTTPCKGPSVYYPGSTIKIVRLADKAITDLPVKSAGVAGAFDPAWSPEGETLAYTAILGRDTQVRAIGLKDLKTRVLANRGTRNEQPAWSRDGKYLAFISTDDRDWGALWYMQSTGESQELLARSAQFSDPAWTPDGIHILASLNRGDNIPILALIDRSNPTLDAAPLLQDRYRMSRASVSPDGSWAVFWTEKANGKPDIILASLDGKQIRPLTNNVLRNFQPAWGPE